MKMLEIRNFRTGKSEYIKLNDEACKHTLDFRVEDGMILIKDYFMKNKIFQKVKVPGYSFELHIVERN